MKNVVISNNVSTGKFVGQVEFLFNGGVCLYQLVASWNFTREDKVDFLYLIPLFVNESLCVLRCVVQCFFEEAGVETKAKLHQKLGFMVNFGLKETPKFTHHIVIEIANNKGFFQGFGEHLKVVVFVFNDKLLVH